MAEPIGIPTDGAARAAVLALVAHDEKKDELLRLARRYRSTLERLELLATSHTGSLLAAELGLPIEIMLSGPQGGDVQIGARIVTGDVDAVVFLRDPLTAHPHEPDIQALLKVCDVHGVPVATNLASAEILLRSLSQAIWWGRDAAGAVHAGAASPIISGSSSGASTSSIASSTFRSAGRASLRRGVDRAARPTPAPQL